MYTIHGHEDPTTCVNFSPKGDFFASSSKDALVLVWKSNFDKLIHPEEEEQAPKPQSTRKRKPPSKSPPFQPQVARLHTTRQQQPAEPESGHPAQLPDPSPVEFTSDQKVRVMDSTGGA